MTAERADTLELPPMVAVNQDPRRTAYTVSVDARHGVGTGISATDRARTMRLLAAADTGPADLNRPGHVFPLRARPGGVLERRGHTEAAVDLCRAAGLPPVGMLVEAVGDDGEPLRLPALLELAAAHGLPVASIADLVEWRERRAAGEWHEQRGTGETGVPALPLAPIARVARVAEAHLPSRHGRFTAHAYRDASTGAEHLALTAPTSDGADAPLVRIHSECLTGDVMGSRRCDCGPQLDAALEHVARDGGAVVYLAGHEGRGIGLAAKIAAYELQDGGLDTVDANTVQGLPVDAREYGAAAAILADLGIDQVRLLTNNGDKVRALAERGVTVTERVPLVVGAGPHNLDYLGVKRDRMGHLLPERLAGDADRHAAPTRSGVGRARDGLAAGRSA